MVETEKLRFRKGDLLAIAMVAALAISVILCFLPQNSKQAAMAQIYLNGELIKTVNLDQDQRFVVTDKYSNEITVENGEIAAVLVDTEATLKRVRIYPDHISLEPENPQYRPLVLCGEEMNTVRILGKAVAFTSTVR